MAPDPSVRGVKEAEDSVDKPSNRSPQWVKYKKSTTKTKAFYSDSEDSRSESKVGIT